MVISKVKLPRLLDKDTLEFVRRIQPIKATVELNITPLSTASLTLREDDDLPARSYVEMFTAMGSAGIYRVRAPQNTYGNGEDSSISELEHAVTEVGDWLVKTEIEENMDAASAIQTIFSHYGGNKWQLGSMTGLNSVQVAVQVDHDIVLQALLNILSQVPDRMMDFDFTTNPWTINFKVRDSVVSAEGRLGRNVRTASITYDDSALCTRAYYECESTSGGSVDGIPLFDASKNYSAGSYVNYNSKLYLLPDGHVSGVTWANTVKSEVTNIPSTTWAYVDADTISTWGIVERTVNTGNDFTQAEAMRVASDYVRKHRNPKLSIQIDAGELSSITGESMDTFQIGKLLRLALPKYGITVEECITAMSWNDVYDNPYSITVNLADEEDTTVTFLHEVEETGTSTSAGGGGGGGKKQDDAWKEYRTKIEQTDMYLDLWARRYNKAEEILQQAGLYIDSNGALIYAQDNERNVGAKLQVQADKIGLVVGTNQDGNYIKAAEISTSINEDGSGNANIMADHIYIGPISGADSDYTGKTLDGTVTAITSDFTTVNTLLARKIEAEDITANIIKARLATASGVSCIDFSATTGGFTDLSASSSLVVAQQAHDVYNITKSVDGKTLNVYKHSGSFTFSRAINSASWEWANGSAKVTLQPQDQSFTSPAVDTYTVSGDPSYDSSTKIITQNIVVVDEDGNTVKALAVNVSGSNAYSAGETSGITAGKAAMGLSANTSNHTINVSESSTKSLTITCTKGSMVYSSTNHNYAYVFNANAGSSVMAAASGTTGTEAYDAGVTAGRTAGANGVTINKSSWSSGTATFTKSTGTASTKGVTVGLDGSWSGNSYNYTIKDYYGNSSGVSTGKTGSIDASQIYVNGYNQGGTQCWMGYASGPGANHQGTLTQGAYICRSLSSINTSGQTTTYLERNVTWLVPSDRYQEGYDAGYAAGGCSHTFWGYVGLYQSSITVEGETYSLYLFSQSRKNNATTRVYK